MHLIIPYFPYARQDKPISNETCGSCFTFRCLLEPYLYPHTTLYLLDVHSEKSYEYFGKYMKTKIINHIPIDQIKLAMIGYDIMLLPDEGAFNRYKQVNPFQTTHCVKIRNQLTGAIESITIPDADFKDKRVLIVDDICDGGGTFIEIAKQLKEKGASRIGLHVSHGIFSKGMDVLHGAGINEIHCLSYEDFYQKVIDGEIK
jgi:ribose-phosphate pyrophosphokinase